MPGFGGRELIDRVRQVKPLLPVVLMSGYPLENEVMAEKVLFLPKPFKPFMVANMIRGLLDCEAAK